MLCIACHCKNDKSGFLKADCKQAKRVNPALIPKTNFSTLLPSPATTACSRAVKPDVKQEAPRRTSSWAIQSTGR